MYRSLKISVQISFDKLYHKKMDEESFLSFKDGAETIIEDGKVALLQNGEELRYFDEYHCKVSKRRIRQ